MQRPLEQVIILVIDDEESTRRMLRLLLSGMGYQVLLAPDGETGLDVFEREKPWLVLTDIKMPGMDGLEVLKRIKKDAPKTEVVVVTGHGDMDLAVEALKLNASDFLIKPVKKEALEVSLQRAVEKVRMQQLLDSYTNELEVKVEEATGELRKTCLQLTRLSEVNRGLGELSKVGEIVDFLLEKIAATGPLVPGGMLLFDSAQEELHLWGHREPLNMGPQWAEAVQRLRQAQLAEELGLDSGEIISDEAKALLLPLLEDGQKCVGGLILLCPGGLPSADELSVTALMLSQAAGAITRAIRQEEEFSYLESRVASPEGDEDIVGRHAKLKEVLRLVAAVAATDSTVLILGESGTGKELVARRIHRISHRRNAPFEVIHCAAFPQTLLESELFGHEKGAFTGAEKAKKGSFERAHGGTVFLDEVAEIPLEAQVKLLRVLQFMEFKRLGGEESVKVDVRVLAATSGDLHKAIARGEFREDLYYRLNVVPIQLPPLRDRMSDLPALVAHFMNKLAKRTGKGVDRISPAALQALLKHTWPGNIRELENALEHALIMCQGPVLTRGDLPSNLLGNSPQSLDGRLSMRDREKFQISEALGRYGGNRVKAAKSLGISRSTLYRKMEEYALE